jgi:hypothetical protein
MRPILILFFLATVINSGCNIFCVRGNGEEIQTNRELDKFHEIETEGNFEVVITKKSNYSAIVEAESNLQPEIMTEVKNGKLIIKNKECISPTSAIKVLVSVPELTGLGLNGTGNIVCNDTFTSGNFSLKLNGTGDIKAKITANSINADINGTGDISLAGSAKTLYLKINGTGDINAFGLTSDKTTIKINGSGDAEVNVNSEIEASLTGNGNVYYKGNNPAVKSKITGTGNIIKK